MKSLIAILSAVADPYGVPDGAPATCHEKATGEDALRSVAGSTVAHDCTLSWYTALLLNWTKTSTPFGGQVTMPLQDTFWGARFGMLTDAFAIRWMFNCHLKKS